MPTFETPALEFDLEAEVSALIAEERAQVEPIAKTALSDYESEGEINDPNHRARAPSEHAVQTPTQVLHLDAEVNALIAEEKANLTNRCNWFQQALEESTEKLNESERVVIQLHHENKALRAKLEDMWDWNSKNQENVQSQDELLRRTTAALRRAEERVKTHEARLADVDDSPVQRQLYQALEQARKQMRELRVELDDKEQEINFLSEALREATAATQVAGSPESRNHMEEKWQHTIDELLVMLVSENTILTQIITRVWELGSTTEATYYDFKQVPLQPVSIPRQPNTLATEYAHEEMAVDVRRNALPALENYAGEPAMDYSPYNCNAGMHYLSRRDSTPTIMTIDTEAEQSYLEEMDVGIDTTHDKEMLNADSDTAITGPLIRRSPPSKAWTAFREKPALDVDSDDEDHEPLSKRKRDPVLGDEDEGLPVNSANKDCFCSQLSMLDESLVRHMASLKLIDNVVAVINKASSPVPPLFSRTFRSIGVQTDEIQVPQDITLEVKEDKEDSARPAFPSFSVPLRSRSFAPFSNGPVYLSAWHRWTWRSAKADRPPAKEKKRPAKLEMPPYPKPDPPLSDTISPIRAALSVPLHPGRHSTERPILKEQGPANTSAWEQGRTTQAADIPVPEPFVPPVRSKMGIDWWIILALVVLIYMWLSGGQEQPDAGWMDANEVPHGVLHQLRDDQVSEFRFPDVMEYQMVHWAQSDRVLHG